MSNVNIFDAKSNLSDLVARVMAGEDIVIAKRGTPLVKLVPVMSSSHKPGTAAGKVIISPDFDAPLDDFAGYR